MIAVLARPAFARLLRGPRARANLAAWFGLAIALAISTRARGLTHGADLVLLDAFGAIVLPLLAFGLVGGLVGSGSFAAGIAPLAAFGARPVLAAAATLTVVVASCTAAGGVLAAVVALLAHGSGDPPVVSDALASAYAGSLGGAAYASFFALGSSFGRSGGGRALFLVLDWIVGAFGGVVSLATPRAHLRNVLGGVGPMGLSGAASAGTLVLLAAIFLGCTLLRSRR